MKQIVRILFVAIMIAFFSNAYSGIVIGSEMFFTSSYGFEATNEVNPTGLNAWKGYNTSLYVGLYPVLSDKNIKGRAKIYVNSSNTTSIFLGGASIAAFNDDKSMEARAFYLEPAVTLSDPMGSGRKYMSQIYNNSINNTVFFSDAGHSSFYPVSMNVGSATNTWLNGVNNALGGWSSVGLYTRANLAGGKIILEDFLAYNMHNYDSYGVVLKANELELGSIKLSAGALLDMLVYKAAQNFSKYNGYQIFDMNKRLPEQSLQQGRHIAYGGFFDLGVGDMLNVFGEFKLTGTRGYFANLDINTNINTGMQIFAGVYTKMIPGTLIELSFGMDAEDNKDVSSNGVETVLNKKSIMQINLKAQAGLDFEVMGMKLFYTLDGTYVTGYDHINTFTSYEFIDFGGDEAQSVSGMDIKASVKFDLFYMFSLRELLRYNSVDFTGTDTHGISQIESRTFVDVDLEDVMAGLWTTVGFRMDSYNVTSTAMSEVGTASYVSPYAEIRYVFGEASFLKISWGVPEEHSEIAKTYGFDYDSYKMRNSQMGLGSTSGELYNRAVYDLVNNYGLHVNVGLKL